MNFWLVFGDDVFRIFYVAMFNSIRVLHFSTGFLLARERSET